MKRFLHPVVFLFSFFCCCGILQAARYMEKLDRGVIAVRSGTSNYVGWRLFGTDPSTIAFNVYRDSMKLNGSPITDSTNYVDSGGSLSSTYSIVPVIDGVEQSGTDPIGVWGQQYLTIPLQVPAGETTPDDVTCSYSPNDCSVGDLDGDGEYEIVLKWDPSNSKDNSQSGYTGNVYLDAYKLNGTFLWRIDLGINIRAGAHYTQFIVYDLDGDGKAEVACRTAPYTKDGLGHYVLLPGDTLTDYRNSSGYILTGPEYLTIFDGQTGEAIANTDFYPDRVNVSQWGDGYGNRVDRFLAGVAYLDGQRPSLIMARGYYGPQSGYSARNEITAWNWRDGELTRLWWFKAGLGINGNINSEYIGQGCHSLSIADVDGDGLDEIVYGSCAIDDDGSPLYSTGLGHGDALHVSDMDPDRPGLEVWQCHESNTIGASLRDAATGEIIFHYDDPDDVGRACAGDITADYRGYEVWASSGCPLYSCTGVNIGSTSFPVNFMVWWDGDLLREFEDSNVISKYGSGTLLTASGCSSNNGTKSTPCLSADILGDWREEVIWRTSDNSSLRLYTTTIPTSYRIYTLMHDCQYREAIAWQNGAYNQPPHPSFYLGDGMDAPPVPDIVLVGSSGLYGDFTGDGIVNLADLTSFVGFWLEDNCATTGELDLNDDCLVNYFEFSALAGNWTGPDRAPPEVPGGLAAWPGDGAVVLDWGDNGDSDLAGYNVYRSTSSGVGYTKLNPSLLSSSEYTDNDVVNGTTYYYAVTAVDMSANESDLSEEAAATPNVITTVTIQEYETGYLGVVTGTVDNNHAGYTGTGFVNTDNAVGKYIQWVVTVPASGSYDLQWRYAFDGSSDRSGSVSVEGITQVTNVSFVSTGDWETWVLSPVVSVDLEAGSNVIQLVAETSDGLANIDWISVTGVSPLPGE